MTALGIPVSFGATFVIMDYLGLTLNLISMFGLIIVVGILVDDAIIICENVYRYMEEGMPAYEAALKGTSEVIDPVTATVTTTVAAFAPMLFMTGIFGKFIYSIPLVVIIALLASLSEAFLSYLLIYTILINTSFIQVKSKKKADGFINSKSIITFLY